MKVYEGTRIPGNSKVTVRSGGNVSKLDPRHDLRNHSPTGFEWGYGGSGPAQLALAICADALQDDDRARRVYQDFKAEAIARISTSAWRMEVQYVIDTVREIETRARTTA